MAQIVTLQLNKEVFKDITIELNKKIILTFFGLFSFIYIFNLIKIFTVLGLSLLIILIFSYIVLLLSKKIVATAISLIFIDLLSLKGLLDLVKPYWNVIFYKYLTSNLQGQYIVNDVAIYTFGFLASFMIISYFNIKISNLGESFDIIFKIQKAGLFMLLRTVYMFLFLLSISYFIAGYPIKPFDKIIQAFLIMFIYFISLILLSEKKELIIQARNTIVS